MSIDVDKDFDSIQHPLMIKNHKEIRNRRNILQQIKGYIQQTCSQHYNKWGKN
jgi:hypothetical protein